MNDNSHSEAAWIYHEATKHSYASIRTNPHFLDWANQPMPFKVESTRSLSIDWAASLTICRTTGMS